MTQYFFNLLSILVLSLFFISNLSGDPLPTPEETGTLIVSYQTGPKAERLDRVRFWLKPQIGIAQIYPKSSESSNRTENSAITRTVVIESLAPGSYHLSFAIPNADNLFEPVPTRTFTLAKGEVLKIDQQIKPRYASLKAKTNLPHSEALPILSLINSNGEVVDSSDQGTLNLSDLLPGNYHLVGDPVKGFKTPPPLNITLSAGQDKRSYLIEYFRDDEPVADNGDTTPLGVITQDYYDQPSGQIYYPRTGQRIYTYPPNTPQEGSVHVKSNLSTATWQILRNDKSVYQGQGSTSGAIRLPTHGNYSIKVDELPDYTIRITPSTFSVRPGDSIRVNISYQKSYGTIELNASIPSGERVTVSVTPLDKRQPIAKPVLLSKENKIFWQSPPLPAGKYTISYQVPSYYAPIPDEVIELKRNQKLQLNPQFSAARSLTLKSNIDEATYLLRTENGARYWKASGKHDIIKELLPGQYILSFSSTDPNVFIAPPERKITIGKFDDQTLESVFKLAGRLLVSSNLERYSISIDALQGDRVSKMHEIVNKSDRFYLPEGRYRIRFHSVNGRNFERPGVNVPNPIEVTIRPYATEEVSVTYPSSPPISKNAQAFILIRSNTAEATYTIESADTFFQSQYRGRNTQIPVDANTTYKITFGPVPNYETPRALDIELKPGERRLISVEYLPSNTWVVIPAGPSIIGDAFEENKINELPPRKINLSEFSIDVYEVTNVQYANWLNHAYKHGTVFYEKEGEHKGIIFDKEGRLLSRTYEATPTSQIAVLEDTLQGISFSSTPGKENYPVIQVSWYGAVAYCRDNDCRLPSEAEWEKAAGMQASQPGEPLRKFRFGFGQDKIDRTWANYKINDSALTHFTVLTTPVGFYNGINKLPLLDYDEEQALTHHALSPYGAYDMSGNVWEWVLDWFATSYPEDFSEQDPQGPVNGTQKVVKGGCYDSLADGVRVAERLGLLLDYADPFTGFRAVKGKPLPHHQSWFEKEKSKFLTL